MVLNIPLFDFHLIPPLSFLRPTIPRQIKAVEEPDVKLSIGERWDRLLKETHEKIENRRLETENVKEKLPPHQEALFNQLKDFEQEVEWTVNHIVWAFNLPTSYAAPGQEDVHFEESKIRIPIDPKKLNLIPTYTQEQLEDVVGGWMRYIEKHIKALKEKVCHIKLQSVKNSSKFFC